MSQWNDCCFEGNLGSDPESRFTNSGKQMWKGNIAVYTGKERHPIWLEVITMNEDVSYELMDRKKGDKIRVRGSIACSPYISKKDNSAQAGLSIWADSITYLPRTQNGGQEQPGKPGTQTSSKFYEGETDPNFDDVPF